MDVCFLCLRVRFLLLPPPPPPGRPNLFSVKSERLYSFFCGNAGGTGTGVGAGAAGLDAGAACGL